MAGRPSPIDAIIGTRTVDGQDVPVTVADRIVAALRAGNFLEPAIQSAGLHPDTVFNWLRMAGQLRIQHAGDFSGAHLSDHQRRCVEFSDAVDLAIGMWEIDTNTTHERLARGGLPQVVTTEEKLPDGGTKTSVRTTHTLPDARVIEWRLKHRFPARYAERLELTGAGGGPIELSSEERASALVVLAQGYREQGALEEPVDAEIVKPRRRKPPSADRSALGSGNPES